MLSKTKLDEVTQLASQLNRDEIIWTSGYLAGLATGNTGTTTTVTPVSKGVSKISILYGTETGNAKKLATQLGSIAKKSGVNAKITGADQYRFADLEKEHHLLIVISTQGDGEPPILAKKFYDTLMESNINVKNVKFSVLALGDSSYPFFCKTGEDVDKRLTALGAQAIVPLAKCDVDYEDDAKQWLQQVLQALQNENSAAVAVTPGAKKQTGKKYYQGTVINSINLNDRGSNKETYHIEISSEEPIAYEPGDALGLIPHNKLETVAKIISLTGVDSQQVVTVGKHETTVETLLKEKLNICYLLAATVKAYGTITGQDIPATRMSLLDLLRIYPVKDAAQFIEILQVLTIQAPRLYSISSSPNAHGENEIHITVAKNTFFLDEEENIGVCSNYLSSLNIEDGFEFYIHKAQHFKLPAEEKDVIMIGPGTGIAPFRSFIAERDATGASGRSWLFFGDQYFVSDFLYQTELQNYLQMGSLSNLDVAFSRDQQEKIYVQHRIKERGAELYDWLNNGAHIYVCGTKSPMSTDVESTLLQILQEEGNQSEDEAKAFLEKLEEEGRYAKDVY